MRHKKRIPYRVHDMRFAESGRAVYEKRIEFLPRSFADRMRRRHGQFVALSDDEFFEIIFGIYGRSDAVQLFFAALLFRGSVLFYGSRIVLFLAVFYDHYVGKIRRDLLRDEFYGYLLSGIDFMLMLAVGRDEDETALVVHAIRYERLYPDVETDRAEFRLKIGKHISPYFMCAFHVSLPSRLEIAEEKQRYLLYQPGEFGFVPLHIQQFEYSRKISVRHHF